MLKCALQALIQFLAKLVSMFTVSLTPYVLEDKAQEYNHLMLKILSNIFFITVLKSGFK